ncbi:hypothetical protein [Xylanimonas ulmi]|uniref:hypothetical protein n=1 Tax=Xylanimonas ulmi TaxID=228973 RepID=UPI00102BDB6E|nr:hypothetical protein [Xylanibacterium ulmi]
MDRPQDGVILGGLRGAYNPALPGWFLQPDNPISGWFGTASPRVDLSPVPQGDGAYWPAQLLSEHRIVTIRGLVRGVSTIEAAAERATLNALAGRRLTVCVEDAGGPRFADGFVSAALDPTVRVLQNGLWFSLIITCPDPNKYGLPVDVPAVGGAVGFDNAGNAPTWPTFVVGGPVTAFTAAIDGQVVSWAGNAPSGVVIDTYDGVPLDPAGNPAGVLVDDDVFQLPPGASSVAVTTTPAGVPVSLRARAAWR